MLDVMRHHALFPMPPEVTQVILGGGSPIDLEGLRIQSHDEAWNFALNYGYDMGVPAQRGHVLRVYEDAIDFLEGVVLEGTNLHVPNELRSLEDPLDLLVWASERPRTLDGRWSCAGLSENDRKFGLFRLGRGRRSARCRRTGRNGHRSCLDAPRLV